MAVQRMLNVNLSVLSLHPRLIQDADGRICVGLQDWNLRPFEDKDYADFRNTEHIS